MKGRPPKSTAQHKADGTFNTTRHSKRLQVPAAKSIPDAPAHFDAAHKKEWVDFCTILHRTGQLTDADKYAIELFVCSSVTAKLTYAILLAEGFVQDGRKHPLHMVYAEAVKTMRAILDQFGGTPVSRMRLKSAEPIEEEVDPLNFLN